MNIEAHPEHTHPPAGRPPGSDPPFGRYHAIRNQVWERQIGRRYTTGPAAGLTSFDFDPMDAWYEEDEQIWFHARDPFRSVEVIESSRLVAFYAEHASVESSVDGVPHPKPVIDGTAISPSLNLSNTISSG